MTDYSAYMTSVDAMTASVVDVFADPADAVTALLDLCAFKADDPGQAAAAAASFCRRAAIAGLCDVLPQHHLASYDAARALLDRILAAVDAEIVYAGDIGDDLCYTALRAVRAAMVADILRRGGSLAPLRTTVFAAPTPALVVAARLYHDATRTADLIEQFPATPHPAFMPLTVTAPSR